MAEGSLDLNGLTAATFSAHRGTSFRVLGTGDDSVELRLTSVDELPRQVGAPRAEPFSLIFIGPRSPQLPQRTYRLKHGVLGELEIFLVPVGYDTEGGVLYEAVFN
jgi:hypothetical protein